MRSEKAVFPASKRVFDLVIVLLMAPVWVVTLAVCAAALLVFEGRPVFYASPRRVYGNRVMKVVKFRTMRRNADKAFNRDVVPVSTQRFLNLPPDSDLYTPIGRILERCMFTELPQLWHVLRGDMSLVGNRPLPVNVVESLREIYPDVDARFGAPAGLTGLVQLVGRDRIADVDRLTLECAYVRRVARSSCMLLDLKILLLTVAAALSPRWQMTHDQAMRMIESDGHGMRPSRATGKDFVPRTIPGDAPNSRR